MNLRFEIVTSLEQFHHITAKWGNLIAVDTETYGKAWDKPENRRLLGISIATLTNPNNTPNALYIPFNSFQDGLWHVHDTSWCYPMLEQWLASKALIGHNFAYDELWLRLAGVNTSWHACTRLMYHMASAPSGAKRYSLKDAQKELLGWPESNKDEMALHVKAMGGDIKKGDHYLATLSTLAKYACLDTMSTALVYSELTSFFNTYTYWDQLHIVMQ